MKNKPKSKKPKSKATFADLPFEELPKEIRDAFWNGTKKRLTFQQGTYKYESDWKGALRAMRERMETPPSEKVREALEELVSPDAVSGLQRKTLAAGKFSSQSRRFRH